jgi:hypothetical protein
MFLMSLIEVANYRSPRLSPRLLQNPSQLFSWGLFITWTIAACLIATRHEFWRDEVRALSLVTEASSLIDLWHSLQDEGHPILWYLLLYVGFSATGSVVVLPVLSLIVAGAAVSLLIFLSPFPRWLKILFVFSGLPLYEYSIMARNYGISMLLFFGFAAMYRSRKSHPLLLGFILAGLSNTNIHSLLLVCLLIFLWGWDTLITERRPLRSSEASDLYQAVAIVAIGSAGALYTVWPTGNMIASDTTQYTTANIIHAVVTAVLAPASQFGELFPASVPIKIRMVVLLCAILGLLVRPPVFLAAYGGLVTLTILFSVVYSSWYRHQGLLVIFLVSLYWIVLDGEGEALCQRWLYKVFQGGLYIGMGLLLALMVISGWSKVYQDWIFQKSASKAFADTLLHTREEFKDAVLIGEPDYILEAVPYYADNPIYIGREKRFGNRVRLLRSVQLELSMGELLCTAWSIQQRKGKPVLIVLGHRFSGFDHIDSGAPPYSAHYFYQRTLSWSPEELDNWKAHTRLEQRFDSHVIGDEAYTIYSLINTESGFQSICHSK